MAKLIVLLSGRICTGKSTLADALAKSFSFHSLSTREFLRAREQTLQAERGVMQNYGEMLDRKTRGAWVRDYLARTIEQMPADAMIVLDSIRAKSQIDRLRESYRPIVVHVHLDCSDAVLEQGYRKRKSKKLKEFTSFAETKLNKTEAAVPLLKDDADICIRTDYSSPPDVVTRVACHLGLHGRQTAPHVDVIIGGQYGSEGKGQIAAFMAPAYQLLVRVGGPNAGHKVFEERQPYTFHQLPSGTRCSEANLLIGPGAAIRLDVLRKEIDECKVEYDRLSIDPQAIIITKEDMAWEGRRLRGTISAGGKHNDLDDAWEGRRLRGTISSTAQGTGRAMIRRIERQKETLFAGGVRELRPFIRPALGVLEHAKRQGHRVLLEGTQGTGLSIFHGHYPYVTSRDTTVAGCISEAGISPHSVRKVVMVCRTYPIRVQSPPGGTSGHMSQEITLAEISRRSQVPLQELRRTERTSTTNRKRRIAEFDWEQLRRSATLNGPTDIALTFADYLDVRNRAARRVDQLTQQTLLFLGDVESIAGAPISLVSVGFDHRTVLDRRSW